MQGLPTDLEMVILDLLLAARGRELYGLEMVRKDKRLGKTSIYVLLTRMIARGFVKARYETDDEKQEQGGRGPKRRLFTATSFGQEMHKARLTADRLAQRAMPLKPAGAL